MVNPECTGCARAVSRSLRGIEGVSEVTVNLVTDNVLVRYDHEKVGPEQIREVIARVGAEALKQQGRRERH